MNFRKLVNLEHMFLPDYSALEKKYKSLSRNVKTFQVPTFENGAEKLVRRVFGISDDTVILPPKLSPLDVLEEDSKEVQIYKRKKLTKISDIETFNEVNSFLKNKISSGFYADKFFTVTNCIDELPKNTSAGYPFYGRKKSKKDKDYALTKVNSWAINDDTLNVLNDMLKHPVTIFHRFSPKVKSITKVIKPEFKIRQILGEPFSIILYERLIFNDFSKFFKRNLQEYHTISLKKTQISRRINNLRRRARDVKGVILCGDINGCDKSVTLTHGLSFFELAEEFIDNKYIKSFNAYATYFLRTPILYIDGLVYSHGSTLTGSWLTSVFTTYIGISSTFYAFKKIYGRFPSADEIQVQGDDFIVVLKSESDKFAFKQYMMELNLRLRLDKSFCVEHFGDVEFLGFIWDEYNQPDQTDKWIIGKLLYPEKFIKIFGPHRIIYRMLSIIINLKRFRTLFNKFKLYDRKMFLDLKFNRLKRFNLLSYSNDYLNIKIPMDKFLIYGWQLL